MSNSTGERRGLRALVLTVIVAVTLGLISWTAPAAMAVAPGITQVAPGGGPLAGGTSVTITGTAFTGASSVTFGGASATFSVDNDTQITATSPVGTAGARDVIVTTPDGSATSIGGFTYVGVPTIDGVSPTSGAAAGGTTMTITGTNLATVNQVLVGGSAAGLGVRTDTSVTVTTPAHAAGLVPVQVRTVGGTVVSNNAFTYIAPPTVASTSPSSGPVAGGQSVTITGTGLTGATAVTFGGAAATLGAITATTIAVTTPAHAAGAVSVLVTTPGGTNAANTAYTYVAAPTITAVAPNAGPASGGQSVVITGTGFVGLSGAAAVTFGGTNATSYTVNTATQITATAPAHAAGPVDVVVTAAGGPITSTGGYTYVAAPNITGATPTQGPAAGGTSVTITGTGFTDATAVAFGGTPATSFTVDNATQIRAVTPAHAAGGVTFTVTTIGGTATSGGTFDYIAAPTVVSASPIAGPIAGGNSVIITGTGFTGATAVTFGGTPATTYTVNSATQITATAPAHAAGSVDIVVTAVGGPSTTGTNAYRYAAVPAVSGLAPTAGPLVGGTSVVITGTDLTGVSAVTFGVTPATSFTEDSATQITAVAPAHVVGPVDVSITTPGGSVTAIGAYTYTEAPGTPGTPTAVAGNASATVTVTPPGLGGGTPTSYTVTAVELHSATCTVTGASGSCVVGGLTNGVAYTFTSTATNAGGTSAASAASTAVTPAGPSGGGGGGETPGNGTTGNNNGTVVVPQNALVFQPGAGELTPGEYRALLNGQPVTVVVRVDALGTGLVITGDTWTIQLRPVAANGTALEVGSNGLVQIGTQGKFTVTGIGFAPGTKVTVWLASTPVELGTFTTNLVGAFIAEVQVPAGTTLGAHMLQVNGFRTGGDVLSVSNGVSVVANPPMVVMSRVSFYSDSSTLTLRAKRQLRALVVNVPRTAKPVMVATGLVNSKGASKTAVSLAKARAQAVADYLKRLRPNGTTSVTTRKMKVPGTSALTGVAVKVTF